MGIIGLVLFFLHPHVIFRVNVCGTRAGLRVKEQGPKVIARLASCVRFDDVCIVSREEGTCIYIRREVAWWGLVCLSVFLSAIHYYYIVALTRS